MLAGMDAPSTTTPPGWYPNPADGTSLRWWDGARWTEHVAPAMPRVAAVAAQELRLEQKSGLGRGEDLVMAGGDVIGRFVWGGIKNRFTGDVTFVTADGAWRVDQRGLIDRKLHIFAADTGAQAALFDFTDMVGRRGRVGTWDGKAYDWTERESSNRGIRFGSGLHRTDWGEWHLGAADGRPILWARTHDHEGHRVMVYPEGRADPWLALLVPLALYLLIRWQDSQVEHSSRMSDL